MVMFDAAYRTPTYTFRVRTPLVDVARRLDELLEPFAHSDANGVPTFDLRPYTDGHVRVYLDGALVLRSNSPAAAFDYVLWRVSNESIERATNFLVLHAGAVAWRRRGIVLPAPPDSGKTTLTGGLVRAGYRYLTDEAAFVDRTTGLLRPFPRPLWMELGTLDLMPGIHDRLPPFLRAPRVSYHVAPTDLRPRSIGSPCKIRFVVAPAYVNGARTSVEPMSRAEAVFLLARNAFNAASLGRSSVELLTKIVTGARCVRLRMGDLPSAVEAVSNLVREADR
jgi:hypothetical protein